MPRQSKDFIRCFLSLGRDEKLEFQDFLHFRIGTEKRASVWYGGILQNYLNQFEKSGRLPTDLTLINSMLHSHSWLERTWEQGFAGPEDAQSYTEAKGRKYLSDLGKELLLYLQFKFLETNRNEVLTKWVKLESLHQRRLEEEVRREYKTLSNTELRSSQDILMRSEIAMQMYKDERMAGKRESYKPNAYFMEATDHLDIFFITEKLKQYCEVHGSTGMSGDPSLTSAFRMRESVLGMAKLPPFEEIALLQLYYHLCMLFEGAKATEHLARFETIYNHYAVGFSEQELMDLENHYQNYLIREINAGAEDLAEMHQHKLLQLYQIRLETGRILINGALLHKHLKNIISLALQLGLLEEAEQILVGYIDQVKVEDREMAMHYNQAHIAFFRGKQSECRRLLSQIPNVDLYYGIDVRSIRLKSLLLTHQERPCHQYTDLDSLETHLASFQKYLDRRRKKRALTGGRWEMQVTRLSVVRKFIRIIQSGKQTSDQQRAIRELLEDLQCNTQCVDRAFLIGFLEKQLGQEI